MKNNCVLVPSCWNLWKGNQNHTKTGNTNLLTKNISKNIYSRILLLILPLLEEIQEYSSDKQKDFFAFDECPVAKKMFQSVIQDVLVLPYG